jgi:phytoene synthase
MISPAERAYLVAEAGETIRRGSKSFSLASHLFDRRTRERAWLLYAWCRHCDDICDGQTLGRDARKVDDREDRLAYIIAGTELALEGMQTRDVAFEGLRVVAAECALPRHLLHDHIFGFAMDLEGWRPETEDDLLGYCYRVAGVVGCLMALVMGMAPDDEETLDRASDLGIAFQLANIARDILDDHAVGRCYLPAKWLSDLQLTPETLADRDKRDRLALAAKRLDRLSRLYEASGRVGAVRLPFRSRWAVLTAAGIYGSIGRLVAERGDRAWDDRAMVNRRAKLGWAAKAFRQSRRNAPLPFSRESLWTRPRPA